jgi:repressor LexA
MSNIGNKEVFAKNLAYYLDRSGKEQKEIAEIIGYSEISYARYENGKREPDISTLCKLANYFNVTVDYLIGRS